MASLLAGVFYAAVVGAVVYFVHKVAWFFRYRKIQEELVTRALDKLHEQADTTVVRWDRGADATWSEASASTSKSPTDYVRRIEGELERLESDLQKSHTPIRSELVRALTGERRRLVLIEIPRSDGQPQRVEIELGFRGVPEPELPDASLFDLEVRSRYGAGRRILAFFLGAADVVYSSQHLVRMSQNSTAPVGLLLRRISLVLLILLALVVDIGFGIRSRLVEFVDQNIGDYIQLESGFLRDVLPSAIALSLWLACYGALYLALYFFLRWRSGRHLRALEELRVGYAERIARIRDEHLDALDRWASDYGTTLDDAALLTMHQASMLVQRTVHRLRRRIASARLLALAADVAVRFFAKLPESSKGLQDVASSHKHSWLHAVWPRRQEMTYQIEIAQYRHAWRDIEACLIALRGQQPDPDLAGRLWRSLVRYARMFPDIVPEDLFHQLQEAHGETVANLIEETDLDVAELDRRLSELADALQRNVEAAAPLLESRIELTTRSMEAAVAEFTSEALRVRERARLEAMAFEI